VSAPVLSPDARAGAQRVLNGAARRLLAEETNGDVIGAAAAGSNGRALDRRDDQSPPLVEGEPIPVPVGANHDDVPGGA
jgi:hypothetical protein